MYFQTECLIITSLWKEASLFYNLIRSESQIDALVVSDDLDYVDQPLARGHLLTKYGRNPMLRNIAVVKH
ncbi:unnamed protein product [Didymodactylos carnosus]|uniref:Uncharacterized protein n=1 Tax=Didymodactylos carnosus TaxID=1234261 RepID=A0A8S2VEC4_9BILA|nr:unnamed protein product [Didymodactylos carnosus]CAF4394916.1 unnamed protein product [Didymodactylos carnosus]